VPAASRAFAAVFKLPRRWWHLLEGLLGDGIGPTKSPHCICEQVCQCIVVGCGHAVPMLACRDGGTRSNLDCFLPKHFEGDKVICFSGVVAMEDPCLVLFGEESHSVENMDANVNCILVGDVVA
jgi:hypothetical protein